MRKPVAAADHEIFERIWESNWLHGRVAGFRAYRALFAALGRLRRWLMVMATLRSLRHFGKRLADHRKEVIGEPVANKFIRHFKN
jgi:hypothetical protein